MKRTLLLVAALLPMCFSKANAQQTTTVDEHLLHLAEQAYFTDDDDTKAFEYLNEFLQTCPNHPDARYLRARIYYGYDKNDAAITDLRIAVKYHDKNSRVNLSTLYDFMAVIYDEIGQGEMAIDYQQRAIKVARKDHPDKICSFIFDLGNYYYNNGQLEEAEKVFQDVLKENSTYLPAMIGLARNCRDRQEYDKGLDWLEQAKRCDDDYSDIYRFEMQILKAMGRDTEAVDAAINYAITDENASIQLLSEYIGIKYTYGIARLEEVYRKNPTDHRLALTIAYINKDYCEYSKAIEYFRIIEKEYPSAALSYEISKCYEELDDFPKAVEEISKAMELDGTDKYIGSRGDFYRGWGKYKEAIADYMVAMRERPSEGHYFYGIGWCYELMGNNIEALKYYNQGMEIDSSHAYLALNRGDLLKKLGRMSEAEADYKRVLSIEKDPEVGSCRHFALMGLGRTVEAMEWMEKIIALSPDYSGSYYDKACLLSRMGRYDEALDALETALKKGFRRFAHLEHDDDMDCLRNLPQYKPLIAQYR